MSHKVHCFKTITLPPPSANFKNSMKKCVMQNVRTFVYNKINADYPAFVEVSGFLYIRTSRYAECNAFCIQIPFSKI